MHIYICTYIRVCIRIPMCIYVYILIPTYIFVYIFIHAHNVKDILAFWTCWYVKGKEVATADS